MLFTIVDTHFACKVETRLQTFLSTHDVVLLTNPHVKSVTHNSYQFQEAFGCCVVVPPFICKVLFAHLIHTRMNICHEPTDGLTYITLVVCDS